MPAVHVFVYGWRHDSPPPPGVLPRQSFEASVSVARMHGLPVERTVFAMQSRRALSYGVFHNDVICTSHLGFVLCHEDAFASQSSVVDEMCAKFRLVCDEELTVMTIGRNELSLKEAVESYFFNSQVVTASNGEVWLLAPQECATSRRAKRLIDECLRDPRVPFCKVRYVDLSQSMRNGGGPACLRLRLPLSESELDAIPRGVVLSPSLCERIEASITACYPERFDFAAPTSDRFAQNVADAGNELIEVLGLQDLLPQR